MGCMPVPGQGDFGNLFHRMDSKGFKGHSMNASGTLEDMQAARALMVEKAREAGVPT